MELTGVPMKVSCLHCQQIVDAMIRCYSETDFSQFHNMLETPAFEQERIIEMFGHKRSGKETQIKIPSRKILAYSTVVDHINELKKNGYLEEIYDTKNDVTLLALNESRILCNYIKSNGSVPDEMYNFQTQIIWDFITSIEDWKDYLKKKCQHCGKNVKPELHIGKEVITNKGKYTLKETGELIWKCGTHFRDSKKIVHMKKIDTYFR